MKETFKKMAFYVESTLPKQVTISRNFLLKENKINNTSKPSLNLDSNIKKQSFLIQNQNDH
jgi:hypothetical protein